MNHRQSCLCCAPPTGAGTVRVESSKNPLQTQPDTGKSGLRLKDFQPRSMLHVPQTRIERPRFPVIDVHAHLTWSSNVRSGISVGEEVTLLAQPEDLLPVMDRKGVRTLVNLTGGVGAGLEKSIRSFDQAAPGRFLTLTEPSYEHFPEPNYAQLQGDAIEHAKRVDARGLKLLKTLGLYLRERIDEGPLVAVNDRRFDPMWEACAAYDMPVFLHVSDPEAFFLPTDETNERYEELANHPDWSFYGPEFPSNAELLAARDRLIARHPKTTFALLHVGYNAENLAAVAACLDRYPNTVIDIQKAVKTAADTIRANAAFDAVAAITELGVGEALVSFLDEKGRPAVVERAFVVAPASRLGPLTDAERRAAIQASVLFGHYEEAVDRESAYEMLRAQTEARAVQSAQAPSAGTAAAGGGLNDFLFGSTGPRGAQRDGLVQIPAKTVTRTVGSSIGRQIVRGLLGSLLGGKR